jgi:hypothetical protein
MSLTGKIAKSLSIKFIVKEAKNLLKIVEGNPDSINDPINDGLITYVAGIKWSSLFIVLLSKFINLFEKKKK